MTKIFSAILLVLVVFGSDRVNADTWKSDDLVIWELLNLPSGLAYTLIHFLCFKQV